MTIEAMKQALEALDCIYSPLHVREINKVGAAMTTLRQAIAEVEQEQPEGLRVALRQAVDELRRLHDRDKEWENVTRFMQTTIDRFEADLLRLHTANQELLKALNDIAAYYPKSWAADTAVAAIAKHGEKSA